jgi:hypothetical protein
LKLHSDGRLSRRTALLIAGFYLASIVIIFLVSVSTPSVIPTDWLVLGSIDKFSAQIIHDSNVMSIGSSHAAALRVSYLITIVLAMIGSTATAISAVLANSRISVSARRNVNVSPAFMAIAALVIVVAPFLPLLPTNDWQLFHSFQEAIKTNRLVLAVWNAVFFVGYSTACFYLTIFGFEFIRRRAT